MKPAMAIALAFACLVPLLDVDASSARGDVPAPAQRPAAVTHVGEAENLPL